MAWRNILAATLCGVASLNAFLSWEGDPQPLALQVATAATPPHIVLVMEENKSYSSAFAGMPYLKSLASTYGTETNFWAQHYPSLPNYITLTAGQVPSNMGGKDCAPGSCSTGVNSIFQQLGSNWLVLAESMPGNCALSNSGNYAVRHTAAPYFTTIRTVCKAQDVPYSISTTPNLGAAFTLVAPNLVDDAHSGSLSQADSWLKSFMTKVMATSSYQAGDVLVEITFDSGSNNCGANCPSQVPLVLVRAGLSHHSVTLKATHCSLLKLNEDLLGLPRLGCATTAPDIRSGFGL